MKKLLLLLMTLLATLVFVTSCDFKLNFTPQKPSADDPPKEFTLFSPDTKVSLVLGSKRATDEDRQGYETLKKAITSLLPKGSYLIKTDDYNRSNDNPSEIVVGHTRREISELAYEYLAEKGTPGEGNSHFVIYCHDGALAIAGDGKYAIDAAIDYFLNIIVDGETTLVLDYDFVDYVSFSVASHEAMLDAKYDAEEEAYLDGLWADLAEDIGSDAADAVKKLYDYYGTEWLTWLANLYDPDTGCFYYSNSARDNETVTFKGKVYVLLPDAESTDQAHGMMLHLGLFRYFNNSWEKALPKEMREKCLAYIQALQDPDDGYFYHPQWGKAIGDARRGRDLSQCISIIKRMGGTPLYKTAIDRLYENEAAATSTVISAFMKTDDHKSSVILTEADLPAHLQSEQALKEYIDKLNVRNNFYSIGHTLSSQTAQIKAAGLGDFCLDYIDTFQSPETGYWDEGVEHNEYEKISAIIKLGALYSGLGRKMKYMDKVIDSAIETILSERTPSHICHVFNSWGGLGAAVGNVASSTTADVDDNTNIQFVRAKIYERLPEMIDATIEKLSAFRMTDGSFSYWPGRVAHETQGVPVALYGLAEGDVNGTSCAMYYIINSLFDSLGQPQIPMLTYKDYRDFIAIINAKEAE